MASAQSFPTARRRPLRRPPLRAVPPEVAVAEAFVRMTGLDPTSVYNRQSPPPRERPPSFGPAKDAAPRPAVGLWVRARARLRGLARRAASWLYHRTLTFCLA